MVPVNLRSHYLELSRNHSISGHFWEERTWSNLTAHYFWPSARNDVINWIRSCVKCNEYNKHVYIQRPLCPIEVNNRFELVCYDLAGPFLPKNSRGNLYALIMVDHFSKWTEIFPLKEATAPEIARLIYDQWCCKYGIMTRLHIDGTNNIHSNVIKHLCSLIGSVKSKSSRLHPQGDGMAEATIKNN